MPKQLSYLLSGALPLLVVTLLHWSTPVRAVTEEEHSLWQEANRHQELTGEMVVIPTGRFMMGEEYPLNHYNQDPVRDVEINYSFALGKYEVTQAQWVAVMGRNPSRFKRRDRPVERVSWEDIQEYFKKLNASLGLTGRPDRYRLPSESEWEYAARAGTQTEYSWGDEANQANANCNNCGSQWDNKETAPVGSFAGNPWGLHDMHGNVYEWVQDCWIRNYDDAPTDGSARLDGECTRRVLRGGSWNYSLEYMRSASRDRHITIIRLDRLGFRVARTLPQ